MRLPVFRLTLDHSRRHPVVFFAVAAHPVWFIAAAVAVLAWVLA